MYRVTASIIIHSVNIARYAKLPFYGIIFFMEELFKYTFSEKNQITITGINFSRGIIHIPETLEDFPVTAIEPYAFAGNQELAEVILPGTLVRVGAHAFYNCKKLGTVELHDGIRELEDGAFKNCYSLNRIIMHCHNGREGCIRNLMSDNIHEVRLDIIYDSGDKSRLTFPAFEDDYVENTPARIFQAVSYGSGGAYRQCMQVGTLDYREFDNLFERSVREDRFEAALFNSIGRLEFPYKLFASAKERYVKFLRDNETRAAKTLIDIGDIDGIRLMCGLCCFTKEGADAASVMAAEQNKPQITGMLMAYRQEHFKPQRKHYEL